MGKLQLLANSSKGVLCRELQYVHGCVCVQGVGVWYIQLIKSAYAVECFERDNFTRVFGLSGTPSSAFLPYLHTNHDG
jgi:hypothetical protein